MSEQGTLRCARCVMDDASDGVITFDESMLCNYCSNALKRPQNGWTQEEKTQRLESLLQEMRSAGRDNQYDCIMGLSGGLDSSYLAMLGSMWGLRVLAVHIDDGFDSEVSKRNIRRLVAATGFDYLTIKPDAQQYAELTKAYMYAGVPNLAVPQDNLLFTFLHQKAMQFGITYFASGGNFASESVLQRGNTHTAYDIVNIRDINRRFGAASLDKLALMSTHQRLMDAISGRLKTVRPLDLIDYRTDQALRELSDFCGFEYYGTKHLENRLTEFIQLYWFYEKFGVDKRTSHLSSLIVSGQLTRDEALLELEKPVYEDQQMEECISVVTDRLNLDRSELDRMMAMPPRQHSDYAVEEGRLWSSVTSRYRLATRRSHVFRALRSRGWSLSRFNRS